MDFKLWVARAGGRRDLNDYFQEGIAVIKMMNANIHIIAMIQMAKNVSRIDLFILLCLHIWKYEKLLIIIQKCFSQILNKVITFHNLDVLE